MTQDIDVSDYHTLVMGSQDFAAMDRRANEGRQTLINPYYNLLGAMMQMALQRIEIIQKWATKFPEVWQRRQIILNKLGPGPAAIYLKDLAAGRLAIAGVNWSGSEEDLRFMREYESRRAKCRFHLDWVMDDSPIDNLSGRFTFAHICAFAKNPDLQEVDVAREQILLRFRREASIEIWRPVNDRLMKSIAAAFVGTGSGFRLWHARTRNPKNSCQ